MQQDVTERQQAHRERRAMAFIAFAVLLIGSAGVIYLRSTAPAEPKSTLPSAVDRNLISANPVDYVFVSPNVGWALVHTPNYPFSSVGRFWVFASVDGAKHWHQQLTGPGGITGGASFSIQFVDISHGFVFAPGAPDQLYRTGDGGKHWAALSLPGTVVYEVDFSDAMNGWLLAGPPHAIQDSPFIGPLQLYVTSDGGGSWHRLPDPPPNASLGAFRNAAEAWMGGLGFGRGLIYLSSDSEQTWQPLYLPSPPGQTWDGNAHGGAVILFPSNVTLLPRSGVVAEVADAGEQFFFTSFDTGKTWQYVPAPTGALAFEDALHWWVLTGNTLLKSSDAGQSWTAVSHTAPTTLKGVRVLDAHHAWGETIEQGGYGLFVSSDGGQRWTRVQVPRPNQL